MDKTDNPQSCGNCMFSRREVVVLEDGTHDRRDLHCLRHPPTVKDRFPVTRANDWCGEYKPAKAGKR